MLLLTTRGGARYRKLPEGTITPLRQAQQTETHQAKLGEAGTVFSHPKIQNPESGIRDGTV